MRFFRDVKDEYLEDLGFRAFYEQECHICSNTMALVSRVGQMAADGDALLDRLGISPETFRDLAEGDHCEPETAVRLAKALGMNRPGMFDNCPRRKAAGMNQEGRINGRP